MVRKKKKTNVIKNQKIADALMDLSALDDEEYEIKKAMAIKKMQGFLLEKGYADTFQNIKKLPRITIKGLDANGYERLIAKELRKRVGESDIELSNGFNTIYPLLKTGVISYKTANGTHYTYYRTTDVSEQTFGITIREYALEQGIFYLSSEVKIKEMSKKMPYYISAHSIQPVCNIVFGENREVASKYFSTQEKVLIAQNLELSENAAIEEMDVIIWNTVAYFKSINYLWEIFQTKELDISGIFSDHKETFIDNAFFSIDNIGTSINFDGKSSNKIIDDEKMNLLMRQFKVKIPLEY